jgi:pimeloyl-ACP methyl ester carboxylesterase
MKLWSLIFLALIACKSTSRSKDGNRDLAAAGMGPTMEPTPDDKVPAPADVLPDTRPLSATVSTNSFDCDTLDYGIYWFGKGDVAAKASKDTKNPFFDPTKPTLLFAHGWQAASHVLKRRGSFNYSKTDPFSGIDKDAADAWIAAGWNVGIFYWNQFSDETVVWVAEEKIWTNLPVGWRPCSGEPSFAGVPNGNITDMLYNSFIDAMGDYKGKNIRLAGHSLGNQLVTRLAERLTNEVASGKLSANFKPKRVALLDPFWMKTLKGMDQRAPICREIIARLKKEGIIFERYTTTTLAEDADPNLELTQLIGETEIFPDYYGSLNSPSRHAAAPFLYFLSFANPPPCGTPCKDVGPSASTTDERMLELMNGAVRWTQVGGRDTADTGDNTFIRKLAPKP